MFLPPAGNVLAVSQAKALRNYIFKRKLFPQRSFKRVSEQLSRTCRNNTVKEAAVLWGTQEGTGFFRVMQKQSRSFVKNTTDGDRICRQLFV
jgi:hypothetical protein